MQLWSWKQFCLCGEEPAVSRPESVASTKQLFLNRTETYTVSTHSSTCACHPDTRAALVVLSPKFTNGDAALGGEVTFTMSLGKSDPGRTRTTIPGSMLRPACVAGWPAVEEWCKNHDLCTESCCPTKCWPWWAVLGRARCNLNIS